MKALIALSAASLLAATQAHASTHRHHRHSSNSESSAIVKLEREIAALRDKIDHLSRPEPSPDIWQGPARVPLGIVTASLEIPQAIGSIGEAAAKAALELPHQVIVKPLSQIAESISLDIDRAYLVATSCPGYTMHRQGVILSIARLHPQFVRNLAAAFHEARQADMRPCIYSAYRPPIYGVGGFRDKFYSAHSYGLAVDLGGIGRPGSKQTLLWRAIASRRALYGPYSPFSRSEWNHFQPTPLRMVTLAVPLRSTITARGPLSLSKMWRVADAVIPGPGRHIVRYLHAPRAIRHRHYARHRRAVYARI